MQHPHRQAAALTLRHAIRAVVVGIALLCAAPNVHAEPDLGQVVSRMPIGVDFVAAFDDGASLRAQLHGSPVMLAVAALRRPAAVMDAWSDLATELGMTDAEAFDLLLGRRVVVVGSQLQADAEGDPSWAILSELDPATERRLRSVLKAVPRRIVAGQPVLEFEHGSFLLATSNGRLTCTPDGTFENTPASSILLLAPAADRELFEQMLPLLRCNNPESTLADVPAGRMVASWHTRDVMLVWRLPDPLGSPNRFLGLTLGTGDAGWDADALAYPADGWTTGVDFDALEPWVPSLMGTLPPDAAFAMMGSRQAVGDVRAWIEPLLDTRLPDPRGDAFDRLLGPRSMFAVWLHESAEAPAEPEVLFAAETHSLELLAARADAFMEESLNAPAGGSGEGNRSVVALPVALSDVRSLTLTEVDTNTSATPPTLSWTFVPETAADHAATGAGWWVTHFFPNGQSTAETPEAGPERALKQLAERPAERYLQVGVAQPAAWAGRVRRHTRDATPSPDHPAPALDIATFNEIVLSHVRAAEWAVWHEDTGNLLRARFWIQLGDSEPWSG